jgi:hypothetical protein
MGVVRGDVSPSEVARFNPNLGLRRTLVKSKVDGAALPEC